MSCAPRLSQAAYEAGGTGGEEEEGGEELEAADYEAAYDAAVAREAFGTILRAEDGAGRRWVQQGICPFNCHIARLGPAFRLRIPIRGPELGPRVGPTLCDFCPGRTRGWTRSGRLLTTRRRLWPVERGLAPLFIHPHRLSVVRASRSQAAYEAAVARGGPRADRGSHRR